jgi:tRNA pseudouridine55 synthase
MKHDINGLLVIDKHASITSARAVAIVKKLCCVRKVGHTGTLDPFATGVLICCMNKATKLATFLLQGNKKYFAVLHLGVETDTQDSTGTIISTSDRVEFSEEAIRDVFDKFIGTVEQLPPVYSALKHKGVPLHKLARSGKAVSKPPRRVHISSVEIKEIALPLVHFEITCSAGTYVRTLCSDIGKHLGCGGHLKALRRIESSGFAIEDALTLSELETLTQSKSMPQLLADRIVGMADALPDVPEIFVNGVLEEKILNGNPLSIKDLTPVKTENRKSILKAVDSNRDLLAILSYDKLFEKYAYCCVFQR